MRRYDPFLGKYDINSKKVCETENILGSPGDFMDLNKVSYLQKFASVDMKKWFRQLPIYRDRSSFSVLHNI
jgi:hypothetical protein